MKKKSVVVSGKRYPQEHNWLWCAKSWTVTFVPLRRPPLLNLVIEDRVRETNKVVPMGLLEKRELSFSADYFYVKVYYIERV